MERLISFDSNVLTAFLNANSSSRPSAGEELAAIQLFMYAPIITILPTVTAEAHRIPDDDKRREHIKWVYFNFREAHVGRQTERISSRAQELLTHHPEKDEDDCRIVAEAEAAGVAVLATIDKKLKRLQAYTLVKLLTPTNVLFELGLGPGSRPEREPANGHPLAAVTWWRL